MNSGKIITHRVLAIIESPDGKIYKTKGDNNPTYDSFDVEEKDGIGVVKYVIKYVGFPTVWFNENIKRIRIKG
jgi:signal peptidase I